MCILSFLWIIYNIIHDVVITHCSTSIDSNLPNRLEFIRGISISIGKTLAPITQTDVLTLSDSVTLVVDAMSVTDTLTLNDSVTLVVPAMSVTDTLTLGDSGSVTDKTLAPITQTDILTLGDNAIVAVGACQLLIL